MRSVAKRAFERKRYGRREPSEIIGTMPAVCLYYHYVGHNLKILIKKFDISVVLFVPNKLGKVGAKVEECSKQPLRWNKMPPVLAEPDVEEIL